MKEKALNGKGAAVNIGTSRVNLTQRYVEDIKYNGCGDFTGDLRDETDYRERVGKIFSEVHMTEEVYADLLTDALMETYWQGEETLSRCYWAKRRDTGDVVWVRVDVRIVPQLETGDLYAFYNSWDVTYEKNRDRIMERIIGFDYDYVECICVQNGHFEIMARGKNAMYPCEKGTDYNAEIRAYMERVVVCDDLEERIRMVQIPAIVRQLEAEPLYTQEIDVREPDGSVRRKLLRYAYMDREMGNIVKSCVDINDIVQEEKKKQELLERAIEEAERANGAKSEFLAHMSHDIRTPMNAIIGMTSVAKQECSDGKILEYLDRIQTSSQFLLGLINDILDISRIESGNLTLNKRQVRRRDLESAVETSIRPLMEQKNIKFCFNIHDIREDIYTDPIRFNQIFFNVLSNAAKYTPEGGEVSFTAEKLRTEGETEWTRFTVEDNGVGMSEEFLGHVFEPFTQEWNRSLTQQWQGTGLGLAIVKKLVHIMGGEIEIRSQVSVGTKVWIDLPLMPAEPDGREWKNEPDPARRDLENCRILLAEDNEINTFVARRILEMNGMAVEHAGNGQEAVDMVQAHPKGYFDAIVMDIRMPVMDGLEAARLIRQMDREDVADIPIIAMTANAYEEDVRKSLAAGMDAHLAKPIEPHVILDTLARYIGRKN